MKTGGATPRPSARRGPAVSASSYGVVRMLDETRWEPKKVFHAMSTRYRRRGSRPPADRLTG
ncbi:hypothetical protein [Streptomyces mexicanus]|uniref:hypothetical protein n=1 Tax=Streptomyces mexicanus TaxID=178566 RepID=UPI0031E5487A